MNEDRLIRRDRMRFIKNSICSNLTILAILFDVLYFVNIYQSDKGTYYYVYLIGISIIYNLIFMLAAFLSSEGVKNYMRGYTYPLILLGIIQIVRIFILPMRAHAAVLNDGRQVMGDGQFTYQVVLLILSAVCLLAAAVINYIKCTELQAHLKMLEEQSAAGATAQKSA